MPMPGRDRDLLYRPRYSFSEADHLADVSRGTAKRWLEGYRYRNERGDHVVREPVTPLASATEGVSFLGLVEVVAIGRLKSAGLSLGTIRRVVKNCQDLLGLEHPLVTERFKTDGEHIFIDAGATLMEVGKRKGQRAWYECLAPLLRELDYSDDLARRWWPLGRDEHILIDPAYGFGLPVVANSGVRTEILLERFQAGDKSAQIAYDFNLSQDDVERALQFEITRAA